MVRKSYAINGRQRSRLNHDTEDGTRGQKVRVIFADGFGVGRYLNIERLKNCLIFPIHGRSNFICLMGAVGAAKSC